MSLSATSGTSARQALKSRRPRLWCCKGPGTISDPYHPTPQTQFTCKSSNLLEQVRVARISLHPSLHNCPGGSPPQEEAPLFMTEPAVHRREPALEGQSTPPVVDA